MTAALVVVAALVGVCVGALALFLVERERERRALRRALPLRRIAFPFTGHKLSEPALLAALRVAHAEGATLMPVYLALVPLDLPLDVPLRTECELALPLLEAIEQRAARAGVHVDSRIERGRSVRHALGLLMEHERFERMVVAAAADRSGDGIGADDVAWLITNAPAEVVALRPARDIPIPHPLWLGLDPTADGNGRVTETKPAGGVGLRAPADRGRLGRFRPD